MNIDIEKKAVALAQTYDDLAEEVQELSAEIEAAKRRRVRRLKKLSQDLIAHRAEMEILLRANKGQFEDPRTVVLNGFRLGWEKGKGSVQFADEKAVLKAIHKLLPDRAEALIKTTEKVIKKAMAGLPAAEVKRIGCEVVGTGDQVVIRRVDGDAEKLLAALLQGIEDEAAAAAEGDAAEGN